MTEKVLIYDAKIMSRGEITIPKTVCSALGVSPGDHVTSIIEDGNVRIVNSAIYSLQIFQQEMKRQAAQAGFVSEDDVADWITSSRREEIAE